MDNLKIKEIKEFSENGKNKTKVVFSDSESEKEIVFEGSGKIKTTVSA